MHKLRNFGAGPAKLPEEVYNILKGELTNFEGSGISLLETSHRSPTYEKFNAEVQDIVRNLLEVPNNYKILFLQGGGQGQFAGVPLNLISRTGTADYIVTGIWSKIAAAAARKYGNINLVLPERECYTGVPDQSTWKLDPNASYVHICANDTIHGIEFNFTPDTEGVPLVADMSSNIMTKKFDITKTNFTDNQFFMEGFTLGNARRVEAKFGKTSHLTLAVDGKSLKMMMTVPTILVNFGAIYACAQKNMGTAGVTLVIVREDLLNSALPTCPSILDWTLAAKNDSILNTPPVYAVQVMGRVLQWYKKNGLDKMEELMIQKSSMVYGVIDRSNGFFSSVVVKKDRSKVNIPFRIGPPSDELETEFLQGAEHLGMIQLKGHKLVGGIRVSLYNSVTLEDVEALVEYMNEFYRRHN